VAFPALLDTCVLYPAYLCDTLLRLAEAEAYRPLWSPSILTELRRNLIEAGIPPDRVDRRIDHMSRSFPDAMVTAYETLLDGMDNDQKDRHGGPPAHPVAFARAASSVGATIRETVAEFGPGHSE